MNDGTPMDSIADVKLIIEASDKRGVVRRAEFSATAATTTGSGFSIANDMTRNLRYEAERHLARAENGQSSQFDEPPMRRQDEPEPTPVEPTGYGVDGLASQGLTGTIVFPFDGRQVTGLFIERGRWYPEMPDALPGETDEQYTNRLTGCYGQALIPYDHVRNRQCSIGYHGECSDRATSAAERRCQCPCHSDAETISAAAQRLGAANRQVGRADDEMPAAPDGDVANLVAGAVSLN